MISEPFWAQLLPKIARLLKKTRVLRPWSGGPLKLPSQLKRVPDYYLDEAGDPMFEDMMQETYLSAGYKDIDFQLLEGLGVGELSFENILTHIREDLKDSFSRWKSSGTSDDWIARSSTMLMRPFSATKNSAEAAQVRALPLIPLYDGSWVSSDTGPVFRSHNDRIQVPTDLGLRIIDRRARQGSARVELFKELGLRYCNPKKVIALILEKYNAWNDIPLHCSVSHIRYLYGHLPENEPNLPQKVYLRDQDLRPIYRGFVTPWAKTAIQGDLYFETDDEYGPGELSKALPQSNDGTTISAPGFPLHYINSAYLTAETPVRYHRKLTLEEWLHSCVDVRRVPRLSWPRTHYRRSELSELFVYVIESRSDKLVGTLEAHWSSYEALMTPEIVGTLSKAVVPCENGESKRLQETILPLPSLRHMCRTRGMPQSFPFLRLPFELEEEEKHDWTFLEIFGVTCQQSISFHLECLRHLVRANQESEDISSTSLSNLIEIYEAVEVHSSDSSYEQIKYVPCFFVLHAYSPSCRKLFQDEFAIYVPADGIDPKKWTCPSQSVWKAPSFLDVHCPLDGLEISHGLVGSIFQGFQPYSPKIANFQKQRVSQHTNYQIGPKSGPIRNNYAS